MSTETGGVTLSIEERIKQDAIQIAKDELDNSKPYPSWEYLIEKGALSERNKTIEQMEIILTRILHTSYHLPEVLKNLESLKV